jgi:RNA polymerase sigma-70 factor (ECF subfamily)
MSDRTNDEWLQALKQPAGEAHNEALDDLRNFLLRVVLLYLSEHRSELGGWGYQMVRDLAEDISQDALMNILAKLNSFKGRSKFTSWAYRIVINQAASELRRLRYLDLSLDGLLESEPGAFHALLSDDEQIEPDRRSEQEMYIHLLCEIIEHELSDHQRAAIIGVYLQGHSMDEVAGALDITRNTLYKLLHDARKRLKARLLERHLTQNDILAAFGS